MVAAAIGGGAAARAHDGVVGERHCVAIAVGVATAAFAVLEVYRDCVDDACLGCGDGAASAWLRVVHGTLQCTWLGAHFTWRCVNGVHPVVVDGRDVPSNAPVSIDVATFAD